ncbi:MAG TPA: CoA transferase, partial [Mycobacterium sp.]|nr:CoA transferase [Mycobacterium sp.]
RGPGASPQGVYRCRGEDEWVALAAMDGAARAALAGLLGRPGLEEAGWAERADDFDKLISAWAAGQSVGEAVEALRTAGVAAARVTPAAALLTDPQLRARGFWEMVDHPVAGSFLCTGMPFAFLGRPRRWIRRMPPLYGQHTDEVLTEVLDYRREDLAALRQSGTVSARPAGL